MLTWRNLVAQLLYTERVGGPSPSVSTIGRCVSGVHVEVAPRRKQVEQITDYG